MEAGRRNSYRSVKVGGGKAEAKQKNNTFKKKKPKNARIRKERLSSQVE